MKLTRWEETPERRGYGERFAQAHAAGEDIYGEARLADVLAPREGRILDAGSGMGRIGGWLLDRGHRVVGVDLDAELIEQSRATFPRLPVLPGRLDELTADALSGAGFETQFDLIVCVGNVMILVAPDTERSILANFRALLAPEGRVLVGFNTVGARPNSTVYPVERFFGDVKAVGLEVESHHATYDLRPYDDDGDYVVAVLRNAGVSER